MSECGAPLGRNCPRIYLYIYMYVYIFCGMGAFSGAWRIIDSFVRWAWQKTKWLLAWSPCDPTRWVMGVGK